MDLRRIVIMVVLVAGFVWAWMTSPLTKRLRGESARRPVAQAPLPIGGGPPQVAQPTAGSPSSEASPLSKTALAEWRQRHDQAWRRDPFLTAEEEQALLAPKAPPVQAKSGVSSPPAPLPSYKLRTVLISEAGKVAALDGRLVSEGDLIGEEKVVEIRPDGVVLESAGRRRHISLPGGTAPIAESEPRPRGGRGQ